MILQGFHLPPSFYCGDPIVWRVQYDRTVAGAGNGLVYQFANDQRAFEVEASILSEGFEIRMTAQQSKDLLVAGDFFYRAVLRLDALETSIVAKGKVRIHAPFASGSADLRSDAERALDNVKLMLQGKGGSAVSEYEIRGRRLRYYSIPELLQLRNQLERDVVAERNGNLSGQVIKQRFLARF